jgi:inner membrane protein
MASAFTHAAAAAALAQVLVPGRWGLLLLGALSAAAPDLDVLGFSLGVEYGDLLGHRGLSHSLPFAALSGALLARVWQRRERSVPPPVNAAPLSELRVGLFLFAAIASHGLLDALTNGGLGVAFFAPLSGERFFFPWQPIEVSPISVRRFFSARGWRVLQSELVAVWLPALVPMLLSSLWRRLRPRAG